MKILITGASSGFGSLFTKTLIDKGHTVVASMRGVDGKNKEAAAAAKAKGAHVVEIDVTNEDSVNKGVAAALDAVGGLDVVINNAGVGVLGLQETFTAEDWRKQFDVNVFGVQRVNRAVLPHLREQGSGLLVQISSLLGRMVFPFLGPYNASKFAVEALAENYRVELSAFGVDSIVVEPGGYGTNFQGSLMHASDEQRAKSYGDFANAPQKMMSSFDESLRAEGAPDPQRVADVVAELIDTPAGQRPFRSVVDDMGMAEPVQQLNDASEKVTESVYGAFEMSDMLKLKV